MAICLYCKKHNDPYQWPEEYRIYYSPKVCFHCYCEDPSRGIEEVAALPPEHEDVKQLTEDEDTQSENEIEIDPQDDVFPDVDSGCQIEDDDDDTEDDY